MRSTVDMRISTVERSLRRACRRSARRRRPNRSGLSDQPYTSPSSVAAMAARPRTPDDRATEIFGGGTHVAQCRPYPREWATGSVRRGGGRTGATSTTCGCSEATTHKVAISEFPKGRKYLISLSFRGKASVRPAQVGGFDVNIVIHGSTAVRGRGDLVAYRWALWKLTAPWTHRTRPPHLGKRCAFSTSSTGPFPSNHSRKTPKGPKIALGNPDRPHKV